MEKTKRLATHLLLLAVLVSSNVVSPSKVPTFAPNNVRTERNSS
jgi:hypothetical protein